MAHPEFIFDRYLQGGERISLENLNRVGPLQFSLQVCHLQADIRIAGHTETPPLNMETVLIEPENRRLSLTWRASVACDKKALKVEQIDVHLLQLQLDGGSA